MIENEQENKSSYYAVIPATVLWDHELPAYVRLLYGVISSLTNERGYCWATNRYFADRFKVTTVCVSNWISQLAKKGYIRLEETTRPDNSIQRLIYIADGGLHQQAFNGGKSNDLGGPNGKLKNQNISLMGVNDIDDHNTKFNNQPNTQFNNKKQTHLSVFNQVYLAKDFKINSGLISEWEKVDWNGVDPDCVEDVLGFFKYRTELGKPIKTSKGANGILNNIKTFMAEDVRKLIKKTTEREWIDLKFYDAEKKTLTKNKW